MSIIEMAREVDILTIDHHYLERFATLVRAAAIEEAAGVCEAQGHGRRALEHYASLTYAGAAHDCAAAIRQLMSVPDGKETK